jgi:hypothetical protein
LDLEMLLQVSIKGKVSERATYGVGMSKKTCQKISWNWKILL